jgi:hypothetical protein
VLVVDIAAGKEVEVATGRELQVALGRSSRLPSSNPQPPDLRSASVQPKVPAPMVDLRSSEAR